MKMINNVLLGLLVSVFFLAGCSKSEDNKGPMEKAGQAVDKAMDQVDAYKAAAEQIQACANPTVEEAT